MRPSAAVARVKTAAYLVAGPMALWSFFFLPWTKGPAVLGSESYSGFELLRLATIFSELNLPAGPALVLLLLRGLLLAIPVAAVWVTLLAAGHRWHWGFRLAGGYLVLAGVLMTALSLAGSVNLPESGVVLLLASALAILGSLVRMPRAFRLGGAGRTPNAGSGGLPLGQETQESFVP